MERSSEHPLAAAIVRAARDRGIEITTGTDFVAEAGVGARATVDGRTVAVGRAARRNVGDVDTLVDVSVAGTRIGTIGVADTVKPTSADGIRRLRVLGLRPVLLTGDNRATALAVGTSIGIEPADVVAEVKALLAKLPQSETAITHA